MNSITTTSAGFSLIELLTTVTLLAIVAAGGVQGWTTYRQALRLEQETRQVMAYLQRVQAGAYWHNETRQVNLIWEKEHWCLRDGDNVALSCQQASGSRFVPRARDVQLISATSPTMAFYGVRNAAQTGHLVLGNGAGRMRVVISVWGRIRLCSDTHPVLGYPLC